jgi:hypothetical protein
MLAANEVCTMNLKVLVAPLLVCLVGLGGTVTPAYAERGKKDAAATQAASRSTETDSQRMEKELQRLPWKQFKSVIESIPKLKADVDAYGPAGWQFVKANYAKYRWRKNIDKLDATQKKQLAELIRRAKRSG